jgi:uncharacterized Zn finger protein
MPRLPKGLSQLDDFPAYVPVEKRRRQAQAYARPGWEPVRIMAQRGIAQSFWGRAWCDNIESYADFRSRLERGRSYVRTGAVLDLSMEKGHVKARVLGSHMYDTHVKIGEVPKARWEEVSRRVAGEIGSVVDLLQGRLSANVMAHMCSRESGLFPTPDEISFSCSCPDAAYLCKHVAAVLYGIGARLDEKPELLFQLRGVAANDLIARAGSEITVGASRSGSAKRLVGADLGALFELELGDVQNGVKKRVVKADRSKVRRPSRRRKP